MELNSKPVTIVTTALVAMFAAAAVGLTVMMPASELLGWQTVKHVAKPGDSPLLTFPPAEHLAHALTGLGDDACKAIWKKDFATMAKEDANVQYYAYSLFLGLALVAAGLAIAVIGRLDSEERTIIPQK